MSSFQVRPNAWKDIESIYTYIALDSPESAMRFLDCCEATFSWLARMPRAGRVRLSRSTRTKGIRMWRVIGFPNHTVFYRAARHKVVIVHVYSGVRDLDRLLESARGR